MHIVNSKYISALKEPKMLSISIRKHHICHLPVFSILRSLFDCFSLSAMVELDGDDIRISSRGKLAERDIVQVTLNKRKKSSKTLIYAHVKIMLC